jgi:hypothetical protein
MSKETTLSSQGSSFKLSQPLSETSPQAKRQRSENLASANDLLRSIGLQPLSTKINIGRRTRYIEKKLEQDKLYMRQWYESLLLPPHHLMDRQNVESDGELSENDEDTAPGASISLIGSEYETLLREAECQVAICADEARTLSLLSLVPISWSVERAAEYFECKKTLVRKARKLRQRLGPCPPYFKRLPTVALSEDLRMKVVDFYRQDDVSAIISTSKQAVSIGGGNYLPKRLLLSAVSEAHSMFCEDNPTTKIGVSSFSNLRPKDVTLADEKAAHISSQCKACVNAKFLLQVQKKIENLKSLIELSACDPENEECMSGQCSECCNLQSLKETIEEIMVEKQGSEVTYKQWKTTAGKTKLLDVVSSVDEYIATLLGECKNSLKLHYFVKKRQQLAMRRTRENLADDEVLILMDFAENLGFVIQNEISENYFDRGQCSLHNIIIYRKNSIELKAHSFCFVNDDRTHDVSFVIASLKMLFSEQADLFKGVNRLNFFTDGAAQHYKSRNSMWFMSFCSEIFGIPASWQFHATAHGKGPCDGIGAVIKRQCRRYSLQGINKQNFISVLDATSLEKWAKDNCNTVKVRLLKTDTLNAVRRIMDEVSDYQSRPISGIKKMHYFTSNLSGHVTFKRTSSSNCETTSATTMSFEDSMELVTALRNVK